jgi:hypothetical protein
MYVLHFGSFRQALKEIGYTAPMLMSGPERSWSEDDLRTTLRQIYDEHGHLSITLIANNPDLPSIPTIRHKLGKLSAIYEFIGATQKTQAQIIEEGRARAAAKMRGRPQKRGIRRDWNSAVLVSRLKALLAKHSFLSGPLIEADPKLPCTRTIQDHFGSLMNAYRAAGWHVDRSAAARLRHARLRSKPKRRGRTGR